MDDVQKVVADTEQKMGYNVNLVVARGNWLTPSYPILDELTYGGVDFSEFMQEHFDAWHDWIEEILKGADIQGMLCVFVMRLDSNDPTCEERPPKVVIRELTDEEWERAKTGEKILA